MNGQNISDHPAVAALTSAHAVIIALDDDAKSEPSVAELIGRLEYLNWVLEQTDPILVSKTELDGLAGAAQNLNSAVNSIASNPTTQASSAIQQLDAYFRRFPYPRFKKIPRAESQRIIDQVQAQADEIIAILKHKSELARQELDNLTKDLSAQLNNSTELRRALGQAGDRLDGLARDFDTFYERATGSFEARIVERLTDANSRLSNSIDEFQSKITEDRAKATAQLGEIAADRKTSLEKSERALHDGMKEISENGLDYLKKIRELDGIVGGESSSGQLILSANGESAAYKILGAAALLAFVVGSFFAYRAVQPALVPGVDWHILAGRAGLVVASYIPAWFLASLATKHRRAELAYRSLAVRVAAFDPYLSEFDPADRIGLKKQLAEMFFSPNLQALSNDTVKFRDLKDFERVIAPIESIIDKVRAITTRT